MAGYDETGKTVEDFIAKNSIADTPGKGNK